MSDTSSIIMTVFAGVCGLLGLFIASRAVDLGFSIFGGMLALFAVVYIFTMLRRIGRHT